MRATGADLLAYPLAAAGEACHSPGNTLAGCDDRPKGAPSADGGLDVE